MKFKTLNNREESVSFIRKNVLKFRSILESKTYDFLQNRFSFDLIVHEFSVPGNHRLHIDFFLPDRRLAIECDGEQHRKYNSFFHLNRHAFNQQIARDNIKNDFCQLNKIEMIRISSIKELKQKLCPQ